MESQIIKSFSQNSVLVFGDIILDRYIYGRINRISPESPVPVVEFKRESLMPGGAANAALNITGLGGCALVCGIVGRDRAGQKLEDLLVKESNMQTFFAEVPGRSTTEKTRIVAQQNNQIVRLDREEKSSCDKETEEELKGYFAEMITSAGAVLISDYAKGAVTDELCRDLIQKAQSRDLPVVVDPKGDDFEKYRGATVIKPNLRELEGFSGHINNADEASDVLEQIMKEFDLDGVVLTRGSAGMTILHRGGEPVDMPARAKEVFDVSGAGDTVAAVVALALCSHASLVDAARIGNDAAGIVVSKAGTAPVRAEELLRNVQQAESAESRKIMDFGELKDAVKKERMQDRTIVFTNGCFDLLHYGHVRYLQKAGEQGDFLIVAINADSTVKELKGKGRPVIGEKERAHILASLECVDAVTVFTEEKPLKYLRELKPDVLVKGGDYDREGVVGHEIVDEYGGRVYLAPLENGWSTTGLINRIHGETSED